MDTKRALAAYISGRNGGWDSELKLVPTAAAGAARRDLVETAGVVEPPVHAGVPVPMTLAFERGPGTWRRRLQNASRS